jgi:hypothetical protein
MRRAFPVLALSCALALGCSSSKGSDTEMVVMVWSDLAVPTQLDSVRVDILGQTTARTLSFPLTAGAEDGKKLPLQISLVPGDDQHLGFEVKVTGLLGGTAVVSQEVSSSCILGQRRVLTTFLGRSCVSVSCSPGLTCSGGSCIGIAIAPASLPVYDPAHPPTLSDAGTPSSIDAPAGEGGSGSANDSGLDLSSQRLDGAVERLAVAPDGQAIDADVSPDLGPDVPVGADAVPDAPTMSEDTGRDLAGPDDVLADASRLDLSRPEAASADATLDSPGSACSFACCSADDCPGACQSCSASHTCVPLTNQDDPTLRCLGTCDSTGTCKSKRGQACSPATSGCAAGTTCADGYCCDRACSDSCEACDLAGSLGTCTVVGAGTSPHPGHPGCTSTVPACAGVCNGSSAACFYTTGACGTASCTASTYQAPGTCSAGACALPPTQACPNGQSCSGNTCACAPPMTTCSGSCLNPQTDASNCGGCGQACSASNGTSTCTTGACSMASCAAGYLDCSASENVSRDGCETHAAVDVSNCGQCGKTCPSDWANATPTCTGSVCGHQCAAPWENCDSNTANGCEANLNTDALNCGHCGNPCSSTVCRSQTCLTTARYGNTGAGTSTVNFGQDTLAGIQIYVPNPSVLTGLGVVLYGATASRNMVLGLYRDVAGNPADLVASAGPALVTPGGKEVAVAPSAVDLVAGNYWLLGVWDGTASFAANSTATVVWRYAARPYGALPSTAPTGMGSANAVAANLYVVVAQ